MTQTERRVFLIQTLLAEQPQYQSIAIPKTAEEQKVLLRSLLNVRPPKPIGDDFLAVQDAYLQAEIAAKGITDIADLSPVKDGIYLWQGDITTLRCGAIVNAANSGMTGCYAPCHACIDNCIHTFSGIQLRLACAKRIAAQGHAEPTGQAKITSAYNLPCESIIHTVGPIVSTRVTEKDRQLLESCYRSSLELAVQNGVQSIAFCCISTGEFHFPNAEAARIAVETVRAYREQTNSGIEVIFNVFKDVDAEIYRELLR